MNQLKAIWAFVSFKAWRDRREAAIRRANYDQIKAMIVQRHFDGFGGVVLPKKYGPKDLAGFRPPMYQMARTDNNVPVLFWRKDLMTEEVGPPQLKQTAIDEQH